MNIETIKLTSGSHPKNETEACVMELVSLLANEPWSDHPQCASASITLFAIWVNDSGDQSHRDQLLLLAPKIIGTRDFAKERKRATIFSEFAFWNAERAKEFADNCKGVPAATYAESAANYAALAAEYAAKYGAVSAADYARFAATSANYAAPAAEYAAFRIQLFDKAVETLKMAIGV